MLAEDTDKTYRIPDELWKRIEPLLPPEIAGTEDERLRIGDREAMEAILNVFRNGRKWKAIPGSLGAPNTIYSRFRQWREAGVFQRMWREGLLEYDELRAMFWYGRRNRMS